MNVPAAARLPLLIRDAQAPLSQMLKIHEVNVLRLAGLERIESVAETPAGSVSMVVAGTTLILPLGDIVDLAREKARLEREIGRLDAELARFTAKLNNPGFVAKAKPGVVEEQRAREADAARDRDRLLAAYERLAAV
jgi:valyl-tRNA synthetase